MYSHIYRKNKDGNFTVFIPQNITQQDIDDVVATALEGGINYWCCKAEVIEDEYYGEFASDQISRGGSLRLYETESGDHWALTLDKLMFGIVTAIDWGYVSSSNPDNWDACDADAIVQCALFDDLVF